VASDVINQPAAPANSGLSVDVNCDLGESYGNWRLGDDESIMPLVTTANVACGFHGGDPLVMARTAALAREHGIAAGSHPGYPDLLGFGRRAYSLTPEEAAAYIRYQTGALRAFLDAEGLALHHIKPHGALAGYLREDASVAAAVADAVAGFGPGVSFYFPAPVVGFPLVEELRDRGVHVVGEVYPDLSYTPDGELVIERAKRATDVAFAATQMRRWLADGTVQAQDGTLVPLEAESVCVHGDGPNAVEVAAAIRDVVQAAGARLQAVAA
jgi:5-oxoprolinase (ATP-hydrolysing) subunit A